MRAPPHPPTESSYMRQCRTFLTVGAALIAISCGGGDSGGVTPPPLPQPPTVSVSPAAPTLSPGQIVQFSAVVRNSSGAVIPAEIRWSTVGQAVFRGRSGDVYAAAPGSASVIATTLGLVSNVSKAEPVTVTTPTRLPGAFLEIGRKQFGSTLDLTILGVSDTAAGGQDRRIGIVRTTNANTPPDARSTHPLLDAIAECPNGEVYGTEQATGFHGQQLWKLNAQTAEAELVGEINVGSGLVVRVVTCDASNALFVATRAFGLSGSLYRVSRATAAPTLIRAYDFDAIVGMTFSANGVLFAAVVNAFDPFPQPQLLVTISTATGALTPVGAGQPRRSPQVRRLFFSGTRLLGVAWGGGPLVEVNALTGALTTVRNVGIP